MADYFNELHYLGSVDVSIYPDELAREDVEYIIEQILKLKEALESYHEMIKVEVDITNWGAE